MSNTLPDPQTRNETFLNAIANGTTSGLPTPMTRSEQYLDYIAKNGGGGGGDFSYDLTISGHCTGYPTYSDFQGADYDTDKTMSELLDKFNTNGTLDVGGCLENEEAGGTTVKYSAICPFGTYVPYNVATTYQAILSHTIDNGVDALLLKIKDRANTVSVNGWGLVVYQSGGKVYCEIETVM